jgi:hypothetical protein
MLASVIKRLGFAVIDSACLIGSAAAADMKGAQIKELERISVRLKRSLHGRR